MESFPQFAAKAAWRNMPCARCFKSLWAEPSTSPALCFSCRAKVEAEERYQLLVHGMQPASAAAWLLGDFRKPLSVEELAEALSVLADVVHEPEGTAAAKEAAAPVAPREKVRMLVLSLSHPSWGAPLIAAVLQDEGFPVTVEMVDGMLAIWRLSTDEDRWLRLEEGARQGNPLSTEQAAFVESFNPAFRDRELTAPHPGALLCQDILALRGPQRDSGLFLHAAVDAYSEYAFGFLYHTRQPEAAVAVLHNLALPFFKRRNLRTAVVVAADVPEFWPASTNAYQRYLDLLNIGEEPALQTGAPTTGLMERFAHDFKTDFLDRNEALLSDARLTTLRTKLDNWLDYYNAQRMLRGYPNYGAAPTDRIQRYLDNQVQSSA